MSLEKKRLCLRINRRSFLAFFVLFLVTYSTEIGTSVIGVAMLLATYSILPDQTSHLEKQINDLQTLIREIRRDVVFVEQ
jgi:hypothetical protein